MFNSGNQTIQVLAACLTLLTGIFYSIALYRNDAIVQEETLSQYDEYGATCGINATFRQLKKTDGTHANYVELTNAVGGGMVRGKIQPPCKYEDIQTNILTAETEFEAGAAGVLAPIFYTKAAMETVEGADWTAADVESWQNACVDGWNYEGPTGVDAWSDSKAKKSSQYLGVVGISDLNCRARPSPTLGLDRVQIVLDIDNLQQFNVMNDEFARQVAAGYKTGLTLEMCAYAIRALHNANNDPDTDDAGNPGDPQDHFPGTFNVDGFEPMFVYAEVPVRSFDLGGLGTLFVNDGQTNKVHNCIGVHSHSDLAAADRIFGSSVHSCAAILQNVDATAMNTMRNTLADTNNLCYGFDHNRGQADECDDNEHVQCNAGVCVCEACAGLGANIGNAKGDRISGAVTTTCNDCDLGFYPNAAAGCTACPAAAAAVAAGFNERLAATTPYRGQLGAAIGAALCECPVNTCAAQGFCESCAAAGRVNCLGAVTNPLGARPFEVDAAASTDQTTCVAARRRRDVGAVDFIADAALVEEDEAPARRRRSNAGFTNKLLYNDQGTGMMLNSITDMCQAAILAPLSMREVIDHHDSLIPDRDARPDPEAAIGLKKVRSLAPMAVLAMWDKGDKLLEAAWDTVLETYQTVLNHGNTYSSGDCEVMPTGDIFTQAQRMNEFFDTANTYTGLLCMQGVRNDVPAGVDTGNRAASCRTASGGISTGGMTQFGVSLNDLLGEGDHLFVMMGSSYILPTTSLHSVGNARKNAASCTNKCKTIKTLGGVTVITGGVVFVFLLLIFMPACSSLTFGSDKKPIMPINSYSGGPIIMLSLAGLSLFVVLIGITSIMQTETKTMEECGFTSLAGALGNVPMTPNLTPDDPADLNLNAFMYSQPKMGRAGKLRWSAFATSLGVLACFIAILTMSCSEPKDYYFFPTKGGMGGF